MTPPPPPPQVQSGDSDGLGRGLFEELRGRYTTAQERGRVFERLMQYSFLRHPGEYGPSRFNNVWRWMEWPDREAHGYRQDVGIDLVAEQTEASGGGLCAIQTKFHETGAIDKAAIDSFISASSAEVFSRRILVVTSSLTAPAQTMVSKTSPRCEVLYGADIEDWPTDWSEFLDAPETLAFAPTLHQPFPYQADAVAKVVAGFNSRDRGKLVLPCGTGKSVVALWIAEEVAGRGGRVLYLVPSIALMGQTMREWARQRDPEIAHRYIGICSDTRAGRNDEDADMAELAMPVTTDPGQIAEKLSIEDKEAMSAVFCTYQSLELVAQAQADGAPAFDLVLCDEAHRTTGIQEAANASAFTLVHDEDEVLADKRLYMTATPRLYTDQAKAKAAGHAKDFDVYSMDDEAVYGPEFYRLRFGDAVEGGHLTDYKVLVIAVAEDPVLEGFDDLEVSGSGKRIKVDEAVKLTGCWDALADPTTRTPEGRITGQVNPEEAARRAIAFTNTIRNSQQVEQYWGPVADLISPSHKVSVELLACEVRHTDGAKNALERANVISWLQQGDVGGGCRIVTNAKCLTEGVDVPALDAVLFVEPKRSQIDVVQAVGRVMRRSPDKQTGYVVLPVVVPSGSNLADDAVLSGSDFKQVWSVLKALRSHDDRLDVAINTADLTGRLPVTILPGAGVCPDCGQAGCDGGQECDDRCRVSATVQGRLPFEHAVASKLVEKCGDRQYWSRWGQEVARVTATIAAHIRQARRDDPILADAFSQFTEAMRATIGEHITEESLVVMLAQHVVTIPVFDALFSESGFADRNPISKALNELLDEFKAQEVRLRDETRDLDRFYQSVENRLAGAVDGDTRIKVMLEVYETFFKEAMPDAVQRLGIVYTPVELVDFILRSADAVLRQEFGRGLTDEGVHILDPFTGTGTFINRLLTIKDGNGDYLIRDEDLERKFTNTHHPLVPGEGSLHEIHANEVVLLAYYLAAIKIEEGYRERTGHYEPFTGIVLNDTLAANDHSRLPGTGPIRYNSARAQQQSELPIQVILANPPWSAGQKSAGDDNPNIDYPALEERVRTTYGKRHREITGRGAGKSAGNLYVQAIRWASDRLGNLDSAGPQPGVIAFVHPNSLSNATSLAGMRAALRDEFTDIYVVNLRGDAMKSDEERAREGQVIFGIEIREKSEVRKGTGSRNGVQITVLVRNPAKPLDRPATLHYAEVSERSTLKQKFEWLASLGDATSSEFETVPVIQAHDWINLTDGSFNDLMPVCSLGGRAARDDSAVGVHGLGLATNLDVYVYSFSREALEERVQNLIDAYNDAAEYLAADFTVDECTQNENLSLIKWTGTLRQSLKKNENMVFDESRIREVLYRPFTKLWLYEDHRILSSVKTVSAMFPRERERERESLPRRSEQPGNLLGSRHRHHPRSQRQRNQPAHPSRPPTEAIMMAGPSNMAIFGVLASQTLPDLHLMGPGQQTRAMPNQRPSC
ncbi:type ISP restriction/modification enzyme [Candidatus Poriferisocius sp.]|uniref:restriction endonuclease n=1 Tax=Candidatus Poriferisocius sp. TaxID=3101276 RepID=UPI003B019421